MLYCPPAKLRPGTPCRVGKLPTRALAAHESNCWLMRVLQVGARGQMPFSNTIKVSFNTNQSSYSSYSSSVKISPPTLEGLYVVYRFIQFYKNSIIHNYYSYIVVLCNLRPRFNSLINLPFNLFVLVYEYQEVHSKERQLYLNTHGYKSN